MWSENWRTGIGRQVGGLRQSQNKSVEESVLVLTSQSNLSDNISPLFNFHLSQAPSAQSERHNAKKNAE